MPDIAYLGIEVDSKKVQKATKDLVDLEKQAQRVEKATEKLRKLFDSMSKHIEALAKIASVHKQLDKALGLVEKQAGKTKGQVDALEKELKKLEKIDLSQLTKTQIQAFASELGKLNAKLFKVRESLRADVYNDFANRIELLSQHTRKWATNIARAERDLDKLQKEVEQTSFDIKSADALFEEWNRDILRTNLSYSEVASQTRRLAREIKQLGYATEITQSQFDRLKARLSYLSAETQLLNRDTSALQRIHRDLENELGRLSTKIKKTAEDTQKYGNIIGEWWERFFKPGLAFTVIYRFYNLIENTIYKITDAFKEAIEQTGEFASLQAKLALYLSMNAEKGVKFADAMSYSRVIVEKLMEASKTSISSLSELSAGLDELYQHGVTLTPALVKYFASFNDFVIMLAQTTGDNVRQVRSEFAGILEGQLRASNVVVRALKQMGILSDEMVEKLRGMGDKTAIMEEILTRLGPKIQQVIDVIVRTDVSKAMGYWWKSITIGITQADILLSKLMGVNEVFAEMYFRHGKRMAEWFGDPKNLEDTARFLYVIYKLLDKIVTLFERLLKLGTRLPEFLKYAKYLALITLPPPIGFEVFKFLKDLELNERKLKGKTRKGSEDIEDFLRRFRQSVQRAKPEVEETINEVLSDIWTRIAEVQYKLVGKEDVFEKESLFQKYIDKLREAGFTSKSFENNLRRLIEQYFKLQKELELVNYASDISVDKYDDLYKELKDKLIPAFNMLNSQTGEHILGFDKFSARMKELVDSISGVDVPISLVTKWIRKLGLTSNVTKESIEELRKKVEAYIKEVELTKYASKISVDKYGDLYKELKDKLVPAFNTVSSQTGMYILSFDKFSAKMKDLIDSASGLDVPMFMVIKWIRELGLTSEITEDKIDALRRKVEDYQKTLEKEKTRKEFRDVYLKTVLPSYKYDLYKLSEELDKYASVATIEELVRYKYARLEEIWEEQLENARDWKSGMTRFFRDYVDEATNTAKNIESAFSSAFSNMEKAFADFIVTGKLGFRELVDSILADLARLVVRQTILGPIAKAISMALPFGMPFPNIGASSTLPQLTMPTAPAGSLSLFPSASTSPMSNYTLLSPSETASPSLHTGYGSYSKLVPAEIFANAPRLHSGLAPDEFPAILQRGETVLPKGVSPVDIQIIDQRGATAPPVEITQNEIDGRTQIRVLIKSEIEGMISSGELDNLFRQTYGLNRRPY